MWERGLKLTPLAISRYSSASLPMWERGLKLVQWCFNHNLSCRSPCGSVD